MMHPAQGSIELATTNHNSSERFNSLYVALGLQKHEAGYPVVADATDSIGERLPLTPSLWHVLTLRNLDQAFKEINTSMMDRRIDSYSSLLVLDPSTGKAKWHLRQPLSDLMTAHWAYQNNVFISFLMQKASQKQHQLIQCITQLGIWAPLSKSTWYLSTPISSKNVFQSLLSLLDVGDQLCVFDSHGHLAIWQDSTSAPEAAEIKSS